MNKLYEPVIKKIEDLGESQAAKYFSKTRQTIYAWKNKPDNIPLAAVQKVLEEQELGPEQPEAISQPEEKSNPFETIESEPVAPVTLGDLASRVEKIEGWIRIQTDPDLPQAGASLIRPAAPAVLPPSSINPSDQGPAISAVTPQPEPSQEQKERGSPPLQQGRKWTDPYPRKN